MDYRNRLIEIMNAGGTVDLGSYRRRLPPTIKQDQQLSVPLSYRIIDGSLKVGHFKDGGYNYVPTSEDLSTIIHHVGETYVAAGIRRYERSLVLEAAYEGVSVELGSYALPLNKEFTGMDKGTRVFYFLEEGRVMVRLPGREAVPVNSRTSLEKILDRVGPFQVEKAARDIEQSKQYAASN